MLAAERYEGEMTFDGEPWRGNGAITRANTPRSEGIGTTSKRSLVGENAPRNREAVQECSPGRKAWVG